MGVIDPFAALQARQCLLPRLRKDRNKSRVTYIHGAEEPTQKQCPRESTGKNKNAQKKTGTGL